MRIRKITKRKPYTRYGVPTRRADPKGRMRLAIGLAVTFVLVMAAIGGFKYVRHTHALVHTTVSQKTTVAAAVKPAPAPSPKPTPKPVAQVSTSCAANTLSNFILVSISKRHMWACSGSKTVYNSAVVTGMENLPADLTPTGTYHIYSKQRDLYLNGSDSTGSWHDYVYYWMPWLSNQYGIYGFHDATWRKPSAFGNISPYSSDASHGCVELPLATAKWLYNWAPVGTTVTIEA